MAARSAPATPLSSASASRPSSPAATSCLSPVWGREDRRPSASGPAMAGLPTGQSTPNLRHAGNGGCPALISPDTTIPAIPIQAEKENDSEPEHRHLAADQ